MSAPRSCPPLRVLVVGAGRAALPQAGCNRRSVGAGGPRRGPGGRHPGRDVRALSTARASSRHGRDRARCAARWPRPSPTRLRDEGEESPGVGEHGDVVERYVDRLPVGAERARAPADQPMQVVIGEPVALATDAVEAEVGDVAVDRRGHERVDTVDEIQLGAQLADQGRVPCAAGLPHRP
jgi:hypothetical protein